MNKDNGDLKIKDDIQEIINDYWNIAAPKYSQKIRNELNTKYIDKWLNKIIQFIPLKMRLDVLDIGTGPGFFSIILSKAGHNVTAIDCSSQMLQEAAANAKIAGVKVKYIKMDAHKPDFQNNNFDLIISRNLTWTLYNPLAAYTAWNKILRPHGKIIIFDANYGNYCFDEQIARQKKENEERYYEIYGVSHKTNTISDEYINEMFLSNKSRPEWDIKVFESLGMNVYVETNISNELYTEASILLNSTTPLFILVAEKYRNSL
ncbi:MAG: class I SAM-dependent methyltransferase [Spirochaetaceae bacterium]|jgi:2-polyprenyl-3-methyl-5-hydroxy-6-metoxy-1,4-benzoquinol methylase|nr:class I SAM-dependent methyltransferase [Spirochaetaceae bacterium]